MNRIIADQAKQTTDTRGNFIREGLNNDNVILMNDNAL